MAARALLVQTLRRSLAWSKDGAASSVHRTVAIRHESGKMGAGAGKGGGGGGSIRDAGGAFGQMEYAREEQYFRALQTEQIKRMKEHLEDEIKYHEAQIKRHQEAVERHKRRRERFLEQTGNQDGDASK